MMSVCKCFTLGPSCAAGRLNATSQPSPPQVKPQPCSTPFHAIHPPHSPSQAALSKPPGGDESGVLI